MKIDKFKNNNFLEKWTNPIYRFSSRLIPFIVLLVFFFPNTAMAQLLCETEPASTTGNLQNSNRLLDSIIIGVAVMIVIFTLVMSVKYLFKPGENNPEHIKNIVKDEGF
ncbi:hypothetical protein EI546_05725 [Aequorivita sp. H23M31]|uniref:Uncharacterized protein n=1 Tax=Aequorivita ciconiae TaxID=2494375 RepID=A0A410G1Z0_9FLAO|nr:hypothetical protein [Aequorivita sp. H23M31]QAA81255.1 hypothetical protein EI546_05725 [Aequorivita sp. H23M31]